MAKQTREYDKENYDCCMSGNKYGHIVLCNSCYEALEKIGYPMPASRGVTKVFVCALCTALGIKTGEVAKEVKKGTTEAAIFLAEHEERLFQRLLNETQRDLQRYKAELAKGSV